MKISFCGVSLHFTYYPAYISLDRLTNDIVSMRADMARIPDELSGVKLDQATKDDLRAGKPVWIEGFTAKNGNEFDSTIQVNAERRGIEYIFPKSEGLNNTIGGVELSPGQTEDFKAGKYIYLEDMTRAKTGEKYDAFVRQDPETGKRYFSRVNPDTGEKVIPREVNGIKLTSGDREDLRNDRPVYLENMIGQDGQPYSKFFKLDGTGSYLFSDRPDRFEEKAGLRVPAEMMGYTYSATERGKLQDNEVVFVKGFTGHDGRKFDGYAVPNFNMGKVEIYNYNPRLAQEQAARQREQQSQGKESTLPPEPKKKGTGTGKTNGEADG